MIDLIVLYWPLILWWLQYVASALSPLLMLRMGYKGRLLLTPAPETNFSVDYAEESEWRR